MSDEYMTTGEAASKLRVSEETIRRWCRSGRLPTVQIGRIHRIPRSAVLQATSNPPTGAPSDTAAAKRQTDEEFEEEQLPSGWVRANTNPQPPNRRRVTIVGQDW